MFDLRTVNAQILGASQKGQDSYIKYIFDHIGTTNKYYVEFGALDGIQLCNTRYHKIHEGWDGLLLDSEYENHSLGLYKEYITKDNIISLFEKYNVPKEFDLLVIDTDGMDYYFLESILTSYSPRVVMIECNIRFQPDESYVLKYNPDWRWNGYGWYGASPLAMKNMVNKFNYTPIYLRFDDMIIMRNDCIPDDIATLDWKDIYPTNNMEIYKEFKEDGEPSKMVESEWQIV